MKNVFLFWIMFCVVAVKAQITDSTKVNQPEIEQSFVRLGIIPYQFLTRSTGGYAGFNIKRFGFEYRFTYTIPTGVDGIGYWATDWFNYQGINNCFFIFPDRGIKKKWKFGLTFGYRQWWYNKQDVHSGPETHERAIASGNMNGYCGGIEGRRNLSRGHFDCYFFWDIIVTGFKVTRTYFESYYEDSPGSRVTYSPPFIEKTYRDPLNITCGFKLGFRKELK